MCAFKRFGNFDDLAGRVIRAEVNGSPYRNRPQVPGILDGSKHDLVVFIRIGEQFIMIDFYYERYFVRILSGHHRQDTKCSSDSIATSFQRKLDDVFRIKISWIFCKRGSGTMFYSLVYRENRNLS